MEFTNKRNLVKRTTVAGVIPTIPGTGATSLTDHTQGGWSATDVYSGEFYANTVDKKLWVRLGDETVLLGYSGMTGTFLNLSDTPSSFAGSAGLFLIVNSGETGLEYGTITANTSLFQFPEFPATFSGLSGYTMVVNSAETALELTPYKNTFLDLTDVSFGAYSASTIFMADAGGAYIEQYDPSTLFVELTGNQVIDGDKTFNGYTLFNSAVSFNTTILFTGLTESIEIDDIINDTGLTYASYTSLATSYAMKIYIDVAIAAAAGITGYTGNWVTTDTTQTISGLKTFSNHTNLSTISATTAIISGDNILSLTSYQYFGDEDTDGSWRFYINPEGDLTVEKRISGTWTFKGSF